jgi:uncharacterized protein (DUF1330 family)
LESDRAAAVINCESEIAAPNAAVEASSARDDRRGGSNDRAEFDRAVRAPACARDLGSEMKANLKTTVIVAASITFGAAAVQLLHAASGPPAVIFGEINVKDQSGYEKEFLPEARKQIGAHGGTYIAGGFNKARALEGAEPANRVVIFSFPNHDAATKWWETDARKMNDEIGKKFATFRILEIEGVEQK